MNQNKLLKGSLQHRPPCFGRPRRQCVVAHVGYVDTHHTYETRFDAHTLRLHQIQGHSIPLGERDISSGYMCAAIVLCSSGASIPPPQPSVGSDASHVLQIHGNVLSTLTLEVTNWFVN